MTAQSDPAATEPNDPARCTLFRHFADLMERYSNYHLLTIRRKNQSDVHFTWARLLSAALDSAHWMREAGIGPGVTVGIMRHHSPELVVDFLGAIFAGALPCVVAPPNPRMSMAVFHAKFEAMSRGSGIDTFLIDAESPEASGACEALRHIRVVVGSTYQEKAPRSGKQLVEALRHLDAESTPDAPLFLQHSSGTSGVPKGVVITHDMLLLQVAVYGGSLGIGRPHSIVSWLPLYHDMGMVACLWGCLVWNVETVLMSNFEWVLDPLSLIDTVIETGGQFIWLPNFAFALLAGTAPERTFGPMDLDHRYWISCSEPTTPAAIDAFFARFASSGTDIESLYVCYAMAENVFAVSQTQHGGPRRLRLDRAALEQDSKVVVLPHDSVPTGAVRVVLSCGRVMQGTEVKIVPIGDFPSSTPVESDRVGQIHLKGDYRFTDYHGRPDLSAAAVIDGWYATGDLGFFHDGELYVVGRCRDMIICGGRNIDPLELEELASLTSGIVPGRACCVGVFNETLGTEDVHLMVEVLPDNDASAAESATAGSTALPNRPEIVRALKQRAAALNLPLRQVWCLPRGWLVKSSSGKISRGLCREKLVRELLTSATV